MHITANKRRIIVASLILICLLPFKNIFEEKCFTYFCSPSSAIVSLFMGAKCQATPDGYMLINEKLNVHVTKVCSATSFFILLLALSISIVVKSFRFREIAKLLWIIPMVYLITILANSTRIISGWITGRWARACFPENLWPGIHLGTGVIVFLSVLIVTYLLLYWRFDNGSKAIQIADN